MGDLSCPDLKQVLWQAQDEEEEAALRAGVQAAKRKAGSVEKIPTNVNGSGEPE